MQLIEKHTFKTTTQQKHTLRVLRSKYHINTSAFIRDAISEKLTREKLSMFKQYKEVQSYLKQMEINPF